MTKLNFLLIVTLVFFTGCAGNQKAIIKYRELVQKRDYKSALEVMEGDSIYKDEESRLLKFLELGTLHLYSGEYYQALQYFDKAHELSDKLFTVSVSKKVAGVIGNQSADNYYGEKYERSLIRYYTILAHYNLYEKGSYEAYKEVVHDNDGKVTGSRQVEAVTLDESKKRFHLTAAKAVLLEWNSILDDYKKTSGGEVTYKDDLLAKFVGAVLHDKADTSTDRQIALGLYKESKNTIFRYYNSYQSFNTKYKDFNSNYKKLPDMKPELVQSSFIASTPLSTAAIAYSDAQIKEMGKADKDNVYIVWHEGTIAAKDIKKYEFPIGLDAAKVTVGTTTDFVGFSKHALVIVDQVIPKISFEMPVIPYRANNEDFRLVVKKAGANVLTKPGVLVDPLSEMAYYTMDAEATANLVKTGTRVAAKHLVALGAAYLTYKNLKEKTGEAVALMSGTAAYNFASRGIAETEKADLRSWMTLPNQIRMNSFKLPAGEYELYSLNAATNVENLVGRFSVDGGEKVSLKTFF
jgi:tetratricopeptide (TPR) repeat protein